MRYFLVRAQIGIVEKYGLDILEQPLISNTVHCVCKFGHGTMLSVSSLHHILLSFLVG